MLFKSSWCNCNIHTRVYAFMQIQAGSEWHVGQFGLEYIGDAFLVAGEPCAWCVLTLTQFLQDLLVWHLFLAVLVGGAWRGRGGRWSGAASLSGWRRDGRWGRIFGRGGRQGLNYWAGINLWRGREKLQGRHGWDSVSFIYSLKAPKKKKKKKRRKKETEGKLAFTVVSSYNGTEDESKPQERKDIKWNIYKHQT